jgi:alkaline phosphatase D
VAILDYLKPGWLEYAAVINPVMSILARLIIRILSLKHLVKYHIRYWKTDELPGLHYGTNFLDFVIEAKRV